MFEELLNKDIFTALINAPKMCKEMDNKRIDMSALEFMCAVPIVAKVLEMSNKERKGGHRFCIGSCCFEYYRKRQKTF